MKRKPAATHNIGIDIDPQAMSSFHCDYPARLVNDGAHRFLADYDYTGSELIYCDPPYLQETRTSHNRYRFEYTQADHVALLMLIQSLRLSSPAITHRCMTNFSAAGTVSSYRP